LLFALCLLQIGILSTLALHFALTLMVGLGQKALAKSSGAVTEGTDAGWLAGRCVFSLLVQQVC